MPPPSPYNLNRWVLIGGAAMIVTGFFATRGSKPPFEIERESAPAVTDAASDASVDVADTRE
jgi:hypothetical protein